MAALELHPDQTQLYAGESVTGLLVLQLAKRTEVREVEALLYGVEFVEVQVREGGRKERHTATYRESVPILEQPLLDPSTRGPLLRAGVYESGTYTMEFVAPIPPQAPESVDARSYHFKGQLNYALRARLGVPWRFDPKALADIEVYRESSPPSREAVFGGSAPRFGTGGTTVSVQLAATQVARGGVVEGEATVVSETAPRLKGVRLSVAERVSGEAKGHAGTRVEPLGEHRLREEEVALGRPVPFEFTVPQDARLSYEGALLRVAHEVSVEADLAWALNPAASVEFRVV